MLNKLSMTLLLALSGTALSGAASAQDQPIKLKMSHFLPVSHSIVTQGLDKFTDEVTSRTNGRVKLEAYPAGQLGSDNLSILKSGLAELVLLVPSYQGDKFPLSTVAELPGMFSLSCEGVARLAQVSKEGGILYDREHKGHGYRVLSVITMPQYKIFSTTKEIKTPEDVAGMKIRANGAAMDKAIRALGAVPVKVPAPELYDAMSRGTIDAGFYPYAGVKPYKMESVIRYSLDGLQLGSAALMLAITNKTWNGLPDNVRKALTEAGQIAQDNLCRYQDDEEAALRDQFVKQNNWKVNLVTKEQAAPWMERVKSVATDWAQELDKAGKPGSAVLKAFQEAKPMK